MFPTLLPSVTSVSSLYAFGVILTNDVDANGHVNEALASCSRALYAIHTLNSRGLYPLLSAPAIHEVTRATTLAIWLYAAPAWWGLLLLQIKCESSAL